MGVRLQVLSGTISLVLLVNAAAPSLAKVDVEVVLSGDATQLGAGVKFFLDGNKLLSGTVGKNLNLHDAACDDDYNCKVNDVTLTTKFNDNGYTVIWESTNTSVIFKDCFDLSGSNWYGGPERYNQNWPLEVQVLDGNDPYVIKKTDNFAVAERYWLNSKGAYIFIDDKVPLFVDQNNEQKGQVCFIAKAENPYINRKRVLLHYSVVLYENPKVAHLDAVNRFLGKPKGHPNENMVAQPIWTTWAKFKKNINDDTVLGFAKDIHSRGFEGGQIEIDEDWEVCFGAHVFKKDKFAKIKDTVKAIKDLGYRVTLWINPFVNNDCEDYSSYGLKKGYFVKNVNGNTTAIWWESSDAHQIDFTNSEAADWFYTRIKALLTDPGVDGFKFDAGETNYAIPPSVYENVDQEEVPNILTSSYVKTCSQFGDLIEVRSGWRTQEYPFFVRMIDKDSIWGIDDGLASLVTTLLQMNLNGYTMVLPDMIGGNGYRQQPTAELIVRWAQANALMPAMQFSYLPWNYPTEKFNGTEIVRKFVKLHEQYSGEILAAMKASIESGTPVNAPIWWVDPTDKVALANGDEFLLGEKILVAPVLVKGATSRKVYIPAGKWKDGNSDKLYHGPTTIANYSAPIDILPYFIKQN